MAQKGTETNLGPNEWLVDEMYEQFLADPKSVSESWREFFADYKRDGIAAPGTAPASTPTAPAAPAKTDQPKAASPKTDQPKAEQPKSEPPKQKPAAAAGNGAELQP